MADIDILPMRAVPTAALVDSNGVASNGSATVAQLAARGIRSICAVDATGVSVGGSTVAQLASAGIRSFCPVDENGLAQDASTADQLRRRGIRPMVLLDANGIALTGSANMLTLAQRGLSYFCPLDEAGNATTMGAVVLITNSTVVETASIGTNVGVLSVAGGTGTYTFSLLSNPGGLFSCAGTNGVNLNVAAALTIGTAPITIRASGGVPTPVDRVFNIIVTAALPANAGGAALPAISGSTVVLSPLNTTNGTWTGSVPITYAYQWKSGGANVGTNASTYTTVAGDIGSTITVVVTATNAGGSASATSAATAAITGTAPVNTVAPVIVGTAIDGQILTVSSNGTWTGTPAPTFTYQWKRGATNVGTNSVNYTLVTADVGANMTCVVTGTNSAGSSTGTSNLLGPVAAAGSTVVRLVIVAGDSQSVGRGLNGGAGPDTFRDPTLDQDMTDVWQYKNNAAFAGYQTFSSDITPLYSPDGSGAGTVPTVDRIGPGEQLGRSLKARYPSDIIVIVPCGTGGTSISATGGWAPGGAQYNYMISSVTAAVAAAPAQWPGATIVKEMVYFDMGANDASASISGNTFFTALANMIATFRSTGQPTWAGVRWCLAGLPTDLINTPVVQQIERALLRVVGATSNVYYVKSISDVPSDGDTLHRGAPANRDIGTKAASIDQNTAIPVWPGSTPVYNAANFALSVPFAGDFTVVGTETGTTGVIPLDSNFEVANIYALNRTLRFLSDGTKPGGSFFTPTMTLMGGNRVTLVSPVSVQTVLPDSMDLGLVVTSGVYGFSFDPANLTLARQSQDTAGTTTVAAGAVVGRVVDSSSNAIVLTQATPVNKPLLQSVGGTVWAWEGDGVNDVLFGLTPAGKNFGISRKFTIVTLLKGAPTAGANPVGEASSTTGTPFYLVNHTNTGTDISFAVRSDSSSGGAGFPVATGVFDSSWKVVTIQYSAVSGIGAQIRVNGVVAATNTAANVGVGPFTVDRLGLFAGPTPSFGGYFAGQIGGVWAIADYVADGVLAIAEQAYAVRAGITLPGGPAVVGAPSMNLIAASDTGSSSSDDITSDATPDFDITFAQIPIAGDIVTIKDGSTVIATHTITSGEAGSSTIDLALGPLSDGTHSLTASHASGSSPGTFSTPLVITIDTTAPTITSSSTFSQPENAAFSATLTANETVTWAITGGANAGSFTLTGANLTLPAKDFEVDPLSWQVIVTATDVAGNNTSQTITVSITDVVIEGSTTRGSFLAAAPFGSVMFYSATNLGGRQSFANAVFVTEN